MSRSTISPRRLALMLLSLLAPGIASAQTSQTLDHPTVVVFANGGGNSSLTNLDDAESAEEGLCVSAEGTSRKQLARSLIAAALNCAANGGPANCSASKIAPLYAACDAACTAGKTTATVKNRNVDCIEEGEYLFHPEGYKNPPNTVVGVCANGNVCTSSLRCTDGSACTEPAASVLPKMKSKRPVMTLAVVSSTSTISLPATDSTVHAPQVRQLWRVGEV